MWWLYDRNTLYGGRVKILQSMDFPVQTFQDLQISPVVAKDVVHQVICALVGNLYCWFYFEFSTRNPANSEDTRFPIPRQLPVCRSNLSKGNVLKKLGTF